MNERNITLISSFGIAILILLSHFKGDFNIFTSYYLMGALALTIVPFIFYAKSCLLDGNKDNYNENLNTSTNDVHKEDDSHVISEVENDKVETDGRIDIILYGADFKDNCKTAECRSTKATYDLIQRETKGKELCNFSFINDKDSIKSVGIETIPTTIINGHTIEGIPSILELRKLISK